MKFRVWNKERRIFEEEIAIDKDGDLMKYSHEGHFSSGWNYIRREEYKNYQITISSEMKDKNKKEIFEGDIVKIISIDPQLNEKIGTVVFKKGSFLIKFNRKTSILLSTKDLKFEIIGDIFEGLFLTKEDKEVIKNLEINETFVFKNRKIKILKKVFRDFGDCTLSCSFYRYGKNCEELKEEGLIPECESELRKDKEDVYFEEIEEN